MLEELIFQAFGFRISVLNGVVDEVRDIYSPFVPRVLLGHQSHLSDYVKLLRTNYEHGDKIEYISMKHIACCSEFCFPFIALEESRSQ